MPSGHGATGLAGRQRAADGAKPRKSWTKLSRVAVRSRVRLIDQSPSETRSVVPSGAHATSDQRGFDGRGDPVSEPSSRASTTPRRPPIPHGGRRVAHPSGDHVGVRRRRSVSAMAGEDLRDRFNFSSSGPQRHRPRRRRGPRPSRWPSGDQLNGEVDAGVAGGTRGEPDRVGGEDDRVLRGSRGTATRRRTRGDLHQETTPGRERRVPRP